MLYEVITIRQFLDDQDTSPQQGQMHRPGHVAGVIGRRQIASQDLDPPRHHPVGGGSVQAGTLSYNFV